MYHPLAQFTKEPTEKFYASFFRRVLNYEDEDDYNETYHDEEFYESCPLFSLNALHMYYIPILIIVGLFGNLMACIVFTSTHLKMRSSSYYLAALSVSDFGFVTVLSIVHCSFNNKLQLYNVDGWCQTFVYISSVCSALSVWLIVAFTVERFIAVQYPFQRPNMCTVSRAKAVVAVLTLCALVSQSYVFWTAGIIKIGEKEYQCEMVPENMAAMKVINFIDTAITLVAPLFLIVVMNTMIARNIFVFGRKLQSANFEEYMMGDRSDQNTPQVK